VRGVLIFYLMKTLLPIILFLYASNLLASLPVFEFDKESKLYTISAEEMRTHDFFQQFSLYSGIDIQYSSEVKSKVSIDLINQTEKQVVSFIDQEFSTIKSFGKNKKLFSLKILPVGKYQSDTWKQAVSNTQAATAYNFEQEMYDELAVKRYEERLLSLGVSEREMIYRFVEHERKSRFKKRNAELKRQQYEKEDKTDLINELKALRSDDPEIYHHQLRIHSKRYPDLQQEVEND